MSNILYVCDRRACASCSPCCEHTKDLNHAKNFTKEFDYYIENGACAILESVSDHKQTGLKKRRNL